MKYALLVYGDPSWDDMPPEEKQAFHGAYRALHAVHHDSPSGAATVIAHYRLRSPEKTTTLRTVDAETVSIAGASNEGSEQLRSVYLLESETSEAVSEFAAQLPAIREGGAVELWPLIETRRSTTRP